MPRILMTTWPFPGHLFPQISIAQALRRRGHDVAFYTGSKGRRAVRDEGFGFFPFQQLDEERVYRVLFDEKRGSVQWAGLIRFQSTLRKWLLETIPQQVEDLEQVLADWRPRLIASDPSMWGPLLVLQEKVGIPVAISSFVPACMVPGPDAPPFGPGLPPPTSRARRLCSALARAGGRLLTARFQKESERIRRLYGLSPLGMPVSAFSGTAPLYLVPCTPGFDYQRRDLPPSVRYVGPCLWNSPRHEGDSEWLRRIPRDLPWVHVTEGTVHIGRPFVLKAAARGLADLPVRVVMTSGGDRDPKELGLRSPPANVFLGRWASHSELLPLCAAVVTTGGAGTVLAALNAGLPLVIIPTEWDKPEIAQRVVESGAGLRLAPRRCTPGRLRAAVRQVLEQPSFRSNARRLAADFSRAGGPDRAAQLLEELCRAEPTRQSGNK